MLLKKLKYSSIGLQPYQRCIKELTVSENLNKVQKLPVALNLNFPWKEERNKIFGYFQYKILILIETNLKLTSNNNFIALFIALLFYSTVLLYCFPDLSRTTKTF